MIYSKKAIWVVNNMTRNIGENWKEIGNDRKKNKQEDKELWKQ